MSELRSKTRNGLIWSSIERVSAQGIQFILGLIVARLLEPSHYGLIGMLAIFFTFSEALVESGLSVYLIQKKDRDNIDFSTAFFYNFGISLLIYSILFLSADAIAEFYGETKLILLVKILGINIIINAFGLVQKAQLTINLDFKTQTKASIISIFISGLAGIYFALNGFGVWALVIQLILRRTLEVAILWYISKWKPLVYFSLNKFRAMFKFGNKLLISAILNSIFLNIYHVLFGKLYSGELLGYYTRANQFSNLPIHNIRVTFLRVAFPVFCQLKNNNEKFKLFHEKAIKSTALILFPIMIGLSVLSEPLIIFTLTEKWSETIWMLQILCIGVMWLPLNALNISIFNAKGRSDLFLISDTIKRVFVLIAIGLTFQTNIKFMLVGFGLANLATYLLNLILIRKYTDYNFFQQLIDIFKVLMISSIMGFFIIIVTKYIPSNLLKIILGSIVGLGTYLGMARIFRIGDLNYIIKFIKDKS